MNTGEKSNTDFYIIDGNSYIYRAFYAIRGLSTSTGMPTNAVFGFANMLLKVIKDKAPALLAIVFDPKGPTRRHGEYKEYKAHRPPMPRDLIPQIPYIHKLVEAFRIPVFVIEGQEADDVIATLARSAESRGMDITIVTGDKDLLQLVGPRIKVYDTLKDKFYGTYGCGGAFQRAARSCGRDHGPHGRRIGQYPRCARHRREDRTNPHQAVQDH